MRTFSQYGETYKLTLCALAYIALAGCGVHVETRYVQTYCLTSAQFEQLKASQPPKVRAQLTGDAAKDVGILSGSAIRLRAHDNGLLEVLGGCIDPNK